MRPRWFCAAALVLGITLTSAAAEADKAGPNENKPPEGFTALFNGKDLTNWKGAVPINLRGKLSAEEMARKQKEADEKAQAHWKVQDGILYYDGKGVSLATAKDYGDFELMIDWKIEEKGDSGIYLRGTPQVQIWDSDNAAGARGKDKSSGSGGLWNNPPGSKGKEPLKKMDRKAGEWNTFHITMRGDKVTVKLNGEVVVDEAPLAPYWDKKAPLPSTGPIELQHHGDKLWFKNVYIKELSR